ncbi:uncharacterized protein LOC144104181 isoform X2 [Amblyomma americanum]
MPLTCEARCLVFILPAVLAATTCATPVPQAAQNITPLPPTSYPDKECCSPRGGRHGKPVGFGGACKWSAQCPPHSACIRNICRRCRIDDDRARGACAYWKDKKQHSIQMYRMAMIIAASVIAALLGCFLACVIAKTFLSRAEPEDTASLVSTSSTVERTPGIQAERPPAYSEVLSQQEELPSYVEAMRRPLNSPPRANPAYVTEVT